MFNYTHSNNDVESSAVYEVYFNETNGDLAVVLSSGQGYTYTGATLADFDELSEGRSPGHYYATKVKRSLGPGKSLGDVGVENDGFVEASHGSPVAALGTPKGLYYTPQSVVTNASNSSNTYVNLAVVAPLTDRHAVSVKFLVGGSSEVKTYTTTASTVDEAVDNLRDATSALGLEVTVKEVTIRFE